MVGHRQHHRDEPGRALPHIADRFGPWVEQLHDIIADQPLDHGRFEPVGAGERQLTLEIRWTPPGTYQSDANPRPQGRDHNEERIVALEPLIKSGADNATDSSPLPLEQIAVWFGEIIAPGIDTYTRDHDTPVTDMRYAAAARSS